MIKLIKEDNINIVYFPDEQRLDLRNTTEFKNSLNDIVSEPGSRLVLDLNQVSFIDSTAFGALLSIYKTARVKESTFVICGVSAEVFELFELLKLDMVFDMYENRNAAIDSIK